MNKKSSLLLLATLFFIPTVSYGEFDPSCDSIEDCIALAASVADPEHPDSMTGRESEVIESIVSLGPESIPHLVELLSDPDLQLARIAAKALRDSKTIDPEYLQQIVLGLDRGLGWLPPALGRINHPDAAREAVGRYLVSTSAPNNQEAYAVILSGVRAIPFIVEAAKCEKSCGDRDHYLLGHVLREMGPAGIHAAGGLLDIAANESSSWEGATGALSMISDLGKAASDLSSQLLQISTNRPELTAAIDLALVGIASPKSGEIMARKLRKDPSVFLLREIAELGPAAVIAGPDVLRLTRHPNWEIRVAAARTVGFLEYSPAIQELIRLLHDDSDVRMNWVAAESLSQIGSEEPLPALLQVEQVHWFPPVQNAARRAIRAITEGPTMVRTTTPNVALQFFAYEHLDEGQLNSCNMEFEPVSANLETKLYQRDVGDAMKALSYIVKWSGLSGSEEPPPGGIDGTIVIELALENMAETVEEIAHVPHVALKVSDGWFVGSDRGEWGGELVYIPDQGTPQALIQTNIEDIYLLGNRFVAVTGLAHMSLNSGMLFSIDKQADGRWLAQPWLALPGAPNSSWLVDTGDLLVNVGSTWPILISPTGEMQLAHCGKPD